jgi:drug/metabolite transporter (DMT)-like permease
MEQAGMFTGASLVLLAGGVLSLLISLLRGGYVGNLKRLPGKYYLICGLLFVSYMVFFYPAVGMVKDRSVILEIGLINYLWPSFTLLFSIPLLSKKASWLLLPGVVVGFLGAALGVAQGNLSNLSGIANHFLASPLPYLLAFFAAVVWGLYSNMNRRLLDDTMNGAVPLFMIISGLSLLFVRGIFPEHSVVPAGLWANVLFISMISAAGYELWDLGMRKGNHTLVAAASFSIPFFSTLLSSLILGIAISKGFWVACILIIAGAILCRLSLKE